MTLSLPHHYREILKGLGEDPEREGLLDTPKRAAKAIAALPLERIVLETDCPYMAPEPVRGTRCDSSLIRYVGEHIASIKGEEPEQVFRQTVENACQVYNLSV